MKKILYAAKVEEEFAEKADALAASKGMDRSTFVRSLLVAAMERDPIRDALAEAMVVIIASQGRKVSTDDAIKLVKELYLAGEFAEELK